MGCPVLHEQAPQNNSDQLKTWVMKLYQKCEWDFRKEEEEEEEDSN